MATEKPRFSVTFSDDSFEKIQKFKEENNISTQSKAVAKLVELAINELGIDTKNPPSAAEAAPGEDIVSMERATNLLMSLGFIEEGKILSSEDFLFLSNVMGILDAWFKKGR